MQAVDRAGRRRDRVCERAPRFVLSAALEHPSRALGDPPVELMPWHIEPDDERRVSHRLAPELPLAGSEGEAGLRKFQGTNDPAPVVRMNASRRVGVTLGKEIVCATGTDIVVGALPTVTRALGGRRRQVEVNERRAEVKPRAADYDGRQTLVQRAVDRSMRQLGVLTDGRLVVEAPDPDELGR